MCWSERAGSMKFRENFFQNFLSDREILMPGSRHFFTANCWRHFATTWFQRNRHCLHHFGVYIAIRGFQRNRGNFHAAAALHFITPKETQSIPSILFFFWKFVHKMLSSLGKKFTHFLSVKCHFSTLHDYFIETTSLN